MTATHSAAGTATRAFETDEYRLDGREKVSGKMRYSADFAPEGFLWAAFATSPFAHARILRIDTTAAKAVPGVRAVLTAEDLGPGKRSGRMLFDYPVLAYDKAIMVGDRVAAIAADTREAAEEAARLVDVEYEELPAVLDAEAALAPGAPIVHPDRANYRFLAKTPPELSHPNVQGSWQCHKDDAEIGGVFARAPHVFRHEFRTPRRHAAYLEPKATVVWIDGDGTVHVQSPNKSPYALANFLAHVTGVERERIVIEPGAIGGDFGSKGWTTDEFPCYFLARATGRPVKRVSSYTNELQFNARNPSETIVLETAVDGDGRFLAHRSTLLYDGGAYAAGIPSPFVMPGFTGYTSIPYDVPHVSVSAQSVYTNTSPGTHVRSPGATALYFAWEQHVDLMAAATGIDPIELRRRNVVREGGRLLTGDEIYRPAGVQVLDRLEAEIRSRPASRDRAWGIGFAVFHTGEGKTALDLTLAPDGTLEILSGVPDQGAGNHTVAQRVVAATMSIAPERVRFRRGSTRDARQDPGAGSSRVTHIVGRAAQIAAEKLVAHLTDATGMTLRDDRFFGVSGSSESFESGVARVLAGTPLTVTAEYDGTHHGPGHPSDFSFCGHAFDVGVDRETGVFTIHDVVFVADAGAIINPVAHQGQIDGGFVFGLGTAAFEELLIDESGKVTNPSLADYKLPTIRDVPPLRTILIDNPGLHGPYGAKMAGEVSNITVGGALANAIANAANVRLTELPITSERVYDALHG